MFIAIREYVTYSLATICTVADLFFGANKMEY